MTKNMIINKTMNSGHFPFMTLHNRNLNNGKHKHVNFSAGFKIYMKKTDLSLHLGK